MPRIRLGVVCVMAAAAAVSMAQGQLISSLSSDNSSRTAVEEERVVRLTLSAVAVPEPALKYQLLPEMLVRSRENAAVWYGKVKAEQTVFFSNRKIWDNISDWAELPLSDLLANEQAAVVGQDNSKFEFLECAARCEKCEWQLPIRDEMFYLILLPEIQEMRMFARLLAVRARYQIAQGKHDEAVRTLQSGFAAARHVSRGETLINGLVGLACSNLMCQQIEALIQQPEAPNLYWALTVLPRPLVELMPGVDAEMYALYFSFPELRELDTRDRGAEYWRSVLMRFVKSIMEFDAGDSPLSSPEAITALAMRGYPIAKRALIADGLPADEVEALPVAQVVLMHTVKTYEVLRDQQFVWLSVPYAESRAGMAQANRRLQNAIVDGVETFPLASMMLPAIQSVQTAWARHERRIGVLRVIEAIRDYGARHDKQLPKSLSDIALPLPDDPVTGQPFEYRVKDGEAHLTGPELPGEPLHYILRFAE